MDEFIHDHQRPSFRDLSISLINLAHCSLDKRAVGERRWTARASSKELSKNVSSTFRKALAPAFLFRLAGCIDNFASMRTALQMAFFNENMQHSAHGHRGGRVRQCFGNLENGGFSPRKDDIHDLAFASAEVRVTGHKIRVNGALND